MHHLGTGVKSTVGRFNWLSGCPWGALFHPLQRQTGGENSQKTISVGEHGGAVSDSDET